VVRLISSSPNDVQPVFDTIVTSAARLCTARFCWVFRFDGKLIHFAADPDSALNNGGASDDFTLYRQSVRCIDRIGP
jgi:hypothetical protein